MPVLYKASFGYLLRHPWQLGLALLGICIGVAVIVAVDIANSSSRKAFLLSMNTINGEATHQIVAGPGGVDEELYVHLRVDSGVRDIAPIVTGYVSVDDQTLQVLGVDVFAERTFRAYTLPATGRRSTLSESTVGEFLTKPGAVLMSSAVATKLGLAIGEDFTITSAGRDYPALLIGTTQSSSSSAALGNILVVDIATAQHWFDKIGHLSRIDVRLPADQGAAASILAELPPGTELLSAESRTRSITEMSTAFMTNLTAMSLLALLIGTFLIYNSVSFAVLQRRGLIGVLRALGLTRRETFSLIVAEGAALGIVGALFGVLLGVWLGEQLLLLVSQSINDLYFRVTVTNVTVSPLSLLVGFVAGVGATGLAAMVPAIEASGYRPQLSLARSVLERRTRRLLPSIALAGLAAAALALIILPLSGTSLVAGLTAMFLLIFGFALCIPVMVDTVSRLTAGVAGRFGGATARLTVRDVSASLSRTGVAIVALAVAVSATVGVSVMVDSFRLAVNDWIGNSLRADIYVGVPGGSLDLELVRDIAQLPGVAEISSSRRIWLEMPEGRTRVLILNRAGPGYGGVELLDAEAEETWRSFEADGAVLVSEPYAYRNAVARGSTLSLNTPLGPQAFNIAATYRSYDANQGTVLMSRTTYRRYWDDEAIDSIGVYLAADAASQRVMERMREVSKGRQSLLMRSNRELRDLSLQIFDRTFVITDVLYWLAVGVAVIGILGSMLALQLERAREFAILRAIGMTPWQLGSMITLQSGFIGLISGLAALPLGLLMAWVLIDVINRRSFGWQMDMSVAPSFLLTALALSTGAALMAGLYPAYRAAVARPALAMREE